MENTIEYIIKRNNRKERFEEKRIWNVIKKAFLSLGYVNNEMTIDQLTEEVVEAIASKFVLDNPPTVEEVQDIVEDRLMYHNFSDVARAYIKYREEHKRLRENRILELIEKEQINAIDEQGTEFVLTRGILTSRYESIIGGLERVNVDLIVDIVCRGVYDGVRFEEIDQLALKELEYLMEEHYEYGFFAARLLLDKLYKDILECGLGSPHIEERYRQQFSEYVHRGVQEELLDEEFLKFDLKKLADHLAHQRDTLFTYLGAQTLYDRYLQKTRSKNGSAKRVFELPQWMWMRVAMGLAINETDREDRAIEFYNTISNLYIVNSTPTLFNSGTKHMQLSSCYINVVEDSLDGIFHNYSSDALLSKWAGGIGTDWTAVRANGTDIKGTNGASSGVIPFIKIYNDIAIAVNQGGKRRGAMAAYLENWHLDIEDFVELKKNTGDERRRAHDIHTALFISDLFMKRVREDGNWMLFTPEKVPELHKTYGKAFVKAYERYEKNPPNPFKVVKARDLWRKTLTMLYETGHPWITFKDTINVRSPQDHVGMVHSSNLCTEITLNTSKSETAVCNLASVNLARMIVNGKLDEDLLAKSIKTAIRMLDNVIDINFYPIPEARNSNIKHRPIGLGVMGYHDALFKLEIPYCSQEQLDFADMSMEKISYHAILNSSLLAKERGYYESYRGSKWDNGVLPLDTLDLLEKERGEPIKVNRNARMDWDKVRATIKKYGMRNSNCLAIAPTATISNISGVVPCVEPIFRNIYTKENISGSFLVINRYLIDRLEKIGLWDRSMINALKLHNGLLGNIKTIPEALRNEFRGTFEIDPTWIIEAAAMRSKWIDQSASTNIFIDTKDGKKVDQIYTEAWKKGIKTTYYLRSIAASQVSKMFDATTAQHAAGDRVANATVTQQTISTMHGTSSKNASCSMDADCEVCQ
ncbi:ribonucleoside-diphosphate reductase subunit alpha [Spirochaetota bacterium]|nr:ribonucleoside-diphosphate reductase subunit alpha [Spirochaetota bacterium]